MAGAAAEIIKKNHYKGQIRFNEEETERVIALWSQQEVLFNCSHNDYFKRDARATATTTMLLQMHKEGLTCDDLQKKMNGLRTYYGKEVGKERASKASGKGKNEVYTSKWPYFNSLHFLRDNITPRKTSSNLEIQCVQEEGVDVESEQEQQTGQDYQENIPAQSLYNPPSKKKTKKNSAALEDELLSTCLQELKRPRDYPDMSRNADISFGQYVSSQLKKFPEGYTKEMLKLEIQQLIVKCMLPRPPQLQDYSGHYMEEI